MIEKIFDEGLLDYPKLLLRMYPRLDMSHEEYIMMLHLFSLAERKRYHLSTIGLARMSGFKTTQVGEIINALFEKNLITIELEKRDDKMGETFSLTPFFKKVTHIFNQEIEELKEAQNLSDIEFIIAEIEELQGRSLSPNHIEMVRQWFSEDYTKNEISEAINLTIQHKRKTINYVDRVLRSEEAYETSSIDEKTAQALRKLVGK